MVMLRSDWLLVEAMALPIPAPTSPPVALTTALPVISISQGLTNPLAPMPMAAPQ